MCSILIESYLSLRSQCYCLPICPSPVEALLSLCVPLALCCAHSHTLPYIIECTWWQHNIKHLDTTSLNLSPLMPECLPAALWCYCLYHITSCLIPFRGKSTQYSWLTESWWFVSFQPTYSIFFTSLYHKMFTIMLPGTVSYLLSPWEIWLSSYKCGPNIILPIWNNLPLSKPLIVHVFCYFRCQFTFPFTQRSSVIKNDFGARVLGLRCRSVSM